MHRPTAKENAAQYVLQKVQPALLGLMDGSVSTLAPLFAAVGLTNQAHKAFFVGLAAAIGAGISMGLAEALSDDGAVTGRGNPVYRGMITGFATAIGGMLHTLPFLITDLNKALHFSLCCCDHRTDRHCHDPLQVYEIAAMVNHITGDRWRRYRISFGDLVR